MLHHFLLEYRKGFCSVFHHYFIESTDIRTRMVSGPVGIWIKINLNHRSASWLQ